MGQLYYAQTQLYSIVLGVKFSGQYALNIAIDYSLLGAHLFRLFSQILYQAPNQLIYTRKASADTRRRGGGLALRSPLLPPSQRRTPRPSRTGRISGRRRTTSRPDTRTLWWGVRGGAGSWVPICLGDHVWVSPLASRLGCPVSSGLKMKAPARSVATHE